MGKNREIKMELNLKEALMLLAGGFVMHYILRRSGDIAIWMMRTFKFGWANSPFITPKYFSHFNNRGEVATDSEVKFDEKQQKAVDSIVQDRLARERSKFSDYEELRKFKAEFEKQQDAKAQQELENAKKYEEAKKGYESKINEYGQIVSKKDQELIDLKKEFQLTNEISKNNGFIEESIALLKNQTVIDKVATLRSRRKTLTAWVS